MVAVEVTVVIRQLHDQYSADDIDQANHTPVIHLYGTDHMHEGHPTIRNQEPVTNDRHIFLGLLLGFCNQDLGHLVFWHSPSQLESYMLGII